MIITLVMDQYGMMNNGTAATARYFAQKMREHGHTIRIVTCIEGVDEDNIFLVKERKIPFITPIVRRSGMVLAKPDTYTLEEAIKGSDVVHFFLQFKLAKKGKTIADKLGIASTAAFHFQPENVTFNIHMEKLGFLNRFLYKYYRKFFDRFSHIHVPSQMMKNLLIENGYKSEIHAISNGVNDEFIKKEVERPEKYKDKFLVLMIGRLSPEKRQDTLIKAVAASKYADKIQLILCGKGSQQKRLEKLSRKLLPNPVEIRFCDRKNLVNTINYCDLYVHASEVESEAIACMEAFVCGLVPVISDSEMSATKQFAINENNLFKNRDFINLAAKIDYFIENPDVKAEAEKQYLELANKYRLDGCVRELEEVFKVAIEENRVRNENIRLEKEYLASKKNKEVRKYLKEKYVFQENAYNEGSPDYMDEYINLVRG